jgi:hypothetical protein
MPGKIGSSSLSHAFAYVETCELVDAFEYGVDGLNEPA